MKRLKIDLDKNEFVMFILFLRNYHESLWMPCHDGHFVPTEKNNQWVDVCVSFMKNELRLADWSETNDGVFTFLQLWEMFRCLFKDSTEKETIDFAKLIYDRWGDLQLK